MKRKILLAGLLIPIVFGGVYANREFRLNLYSSNQATFSASVFSQNDIRDGDIIFQTSRSPQSEAIQLATSSPYSHCGIIYIENGKAYVFEAFQPVKITPLNQWIARGKNGHYVIKRLIGANRILTADVLQKMKREGEKFLGRNYDSAFGWSDEKIYCSELIWKVFQRGAGIELGKLQFLRDFNLSNEVVRKKLKDRYGNNIPLNETVISPSSIYDSELLVTVKSN
jgi:hypothetical protein